MNQPIFIEDSPQQATGNLNARNFYFYIRSFAPAVPMPRDREHTSYPFNMIYVMSPCILLQ